VVETLLTIRDPARLEAVNKEWPIDAMLERAARSAHAALPEAEQAGVAVASREELYRAFLAELARVNQNPSVDPGAEGFDAATWGDPRTWKIIAVRPRLDKKWHELRIVYKADAHAASYAMFRFRPFAEERPEALGANNEAMARMVVGAFFTEDGQLDPALARDRQAHGKKVAELVRRVLEHESSAHPWHHSTFLALPCETRLGGGSKRDGQGGYVSGDGWAWNVMKGVATDGKLVVGGVPILGFVSGLAATEDGKSWAMKCGPRFDKSTEGHDPRMIKLCRETGNTDLPGAGDGYREAGPEDEVVSSFIDAANLFLDHKRAAEEAVPLRDPRRELFEENGMTCSQCHVRRFGVRDLYDPSATDPGAGAPTVLNKRQPPTYFVIVPTERWQPYAIDFQHEQECEVKAAIEERLGIKTSLGCPLRER
jgi:hypothetical protein